MAVKEKARATNHVGARGKDGRPKGSSRHNFREFPKDTKEPGASEINRKLTTNNQYYIDGQFYNTKQLEQMYEDNADWLDKQAFRFRNNPNYTSLANSQKIELGAYEQLIQESIKGQHNRNASRRQGHLDRDALDVLLSPKTQPEESILQIGNKDYCPVMAKQLWAIYADYAKMHNAKYGSHIKILDAVLHTDEVTCHVHERKAYIGVNQHGEACIGKDSALAQLGINRPDMSAKQSRRNCRKQTYSADCRAMWLTVCRQHGLDLETEPRVYADPHGLELTEYKVQQEQNKLADTKQATATEQNRLADLQEQVADGQSVLRSVVSTLRSKGKTLDKLTKDVNGLEEQQADLQQQIADQQADLQEVDMAFYISATVKNEQPDYYNGIVLDYYYEHGLTPPQDLLQGPEL